MNRLEKIDYVLSRGVTVDVENGKVFGVKGEEVKKVSRYGYLQYSFRHGGKQLSVQVHHIIAYVGGLELTEESWINHKDTNKQNNKISNLELSDALHNTRHAWENGCNDGQIRVKGELVSKVFELKEQGLSYRKIGNELGIPKSTIANVLNGVGIYGK